MIFLCIRQSDIKIQPVYDFSKICKIRHSEHPKTCKIRHSKHTETCKIRHSEYPKTCKIRYSEFFSSKLEAKVFIRYHRIKSSIFIRWQRIKNTICKNIGVKIFLDNRVDVGDYSPSTSHCTVRTGLVYGATYI